MSDLRPILVALLVLLALPACKRSGSEAPPPKLFEFVNTLDVGTGPIAITTADLNNDGNLDLITANLESNDVSAMLGKGDGAFQFHIPTHVAAAPKALVAADFDGDGIPDLAVIHANPAVLSVLRGKGDGTFQELFRNELRKTPTSIITADFNRDGRPDIAISLVMDRILIYAGDGHGTFFLAQEFDPGDTPTSITALDVNHDGILDLAVANNGDVGHNFAVFHGKGDATFVPAENYRTKLLPLIVGSGVFRGNGLADLVIGYGSRSTLALFPAKPDGTFGEGIEFGAEGGPTALLAEDFDRDGRQDLAVVNNLSSNLSILRGRGDGTFIQPPINYQTGRGPFGLVKGAFLNGAPPGLAVANQGSNSVTVFLPRWRPGDPPAAQPPGSGGPAAAKESESGRPQ